MTTSSHYSHPSEGRLWLCDLWAAMCVACALVIGVAGQALRCGRGNRVTGAPVALKSR